MDIPECKHRRWTRRPDLVQMHCFLKRKNCDEKECSLCEYCNTNNPSDYVEFRPSTWIVNMPSRGLGDTIIKVTHATGIRRLVNAISRIVGIPCGCKERQEILNNFFPYSNPRQ